MNTTINPPTRRRAATAGRWAGLVGTSVLLIATLGACMRPPTGTPPTTGQPNTTTKPGTPTTQKPPTNPGIPTTITSTIKLTSNFDGGGRTFKGGGSLGSGGDGEGKKPLFDVADGVTVSNLTIGIPESDGIHCLGSCTLKNITWLDILDDAATALGGKGTTMHIIGGSGHHASDKVFQHNGAGEVFIENFTVEDFGKLYRSCGNCSNNGSPRKVTIRNVVAIGPGKTLAGVNSNYHDVADISGVTIKNDSSKKMDTCEVFTGNNKGDEPTKTLSFKDTANTPNCQVRGITRQ